MSDPSNCRSGLVATSALDPGRRRTGVGDRRRRFPVPSRGHHSPVVRSWLYVIAPLPKWLALSTARLSGRRRPNPRGLWSAQRHRSRADAPNASGGQACPYAERPTVNGTALQGSRRPRPRTRRLGIGLRAPLRAGTACRNAASRHCFRVLMGSLSRWMISEVPQSPTLDGRYLGSGCCVRRRTTEHQQ